MGEGELESVAEGSGPPDFLLIHGLVDTLEIWDRLAPQLAEKGRAIRYDQRGHGRSPAPPGPYTREDLAADAFAVLDRHGVDRAVLVGHSMGGVVALSAALLRPERVAGLVLIGTTGRVGEKVARWYERIARAGEADGTAGLARAIYGVGSRRRVAGDAQGIAHVTRVLQTLHGDPLTPRLAALRCPVELVVGANDPMGPRASEILAENLVDATLQVVPDCGHWVHVEEPDVVGGAVHRCASAR